MHYLILQVLALVTFHQSLRWGQRSGGNIIGIGAVNYGVAAAVTAGTFFILLGVGKATADSNLLIVFGMVNGALYFLCLLVMLAAYKTAGVGITSAMIASGSLVPILVSRFAWQESMAGRQWLAVALLPLGMALMRPARNGSRADGKWLNWRADLCLLAAFLLPGLSATIHKATTIYDAPDGSGQPLYMTALFLTAFAGNSAYVFWRRQHLSRADIGIGAWIGLVNIMATAMIIMALRTLPAVIFFPTSSSLVITLNLFVAWRLWRESLTRRQLAGVTVAVAVIILANLGGQAA